MNHKKGTTLEPMGGFYSVEGLVEFGLDVRSVIDPNDSELALRCCRLHHLKP